MRDIKVWQREKNCKEKKKEKVLHVYLQKQDSIACYKTIIS